MNAEIITIGDEILIGQVVDTNSAFIGKELNKIGISIYQISSIQDDKAHIIKALKEAEENADIIIITGGLGPTKDDITKHTICDYFDDTLVENKEVLEHIETLFAKYISTPISDLNRKQALVPSKAQVLKNNFGTAPGMWLEKNGKIFISMPGVPYEMKALISYEIVPRFRKEFKLPYILHKTVLTYGLGESAIANRLTNWEENLPKQIKLAYLPNLSNVRLRLSTKGFDKDKINAEMTRLSKELVNLVSDIFLGFEDESSLEFIVGKLLKKENSTVATAESCTGGKVANLISSVPGASNYFVGSIISYHQSVKISVLGVALETIQKYSVVSAQVAEEMALGVQKKFKTDYSIAITGNAGPTKDLTDASVGTVFISIASFDTVFTEEFSFGQPREKVIRKASAKALEMLRKEILKNSKNKFVN